LTGQPSELSAAAAGGPAPVLDVEALFDPFDREADEWE
jgi:hypothetical protein